MNFLPKSISRLVDELSRLPGIGPKSAQRLAFHLLRSSDSRLEELGGAIVGARDGVLRCETCFTLCSESPCPVCDDPGRDRDLLCVVETALDMLAIEKTGEYRGIYHVLQGKLSPLDGIGPDDIRVAELFERLTTESGAAEDGLAIKEVILALNPDLEGDTTALFLQKKITELGQGEAGSLSERVLNISRIARGIPSGGNLEYTDDATLIRALEGRQRLS
jgi:recombination protein RecR